jgi:hypothetical protein
MRHSSQSRSLDRLQSVGDLIQLRTIGFTLGSATRIATDSLFSRASVNSADTALARMASSIFRIRAEPVQKP